MTDKERIKELEDEIEKYKYACFRAYFELDMHGLKISK